ncbi:unnamed protein product [Rhizophagus irregularis]|uniref:Uncharacterized protein n=1 Tax=Rhizophagus irregularis TaxID=588596 RepID=A0A2I1GD88_9GLOM|nr:hypothetical protein RhiirA4_541960 [Rhizophagus irregularis]CAB4438837.1 unnamed protein product [Rhizophagus irregularis]
MDGHAIVVNYLLENEYKVKVTVDKELSIKDLIASGVYINSVTKLADITKVIPTLTLVSLYYFCTETVEGGDAKTVAGILKNLLMFIHINFINFILRKGLLHSYTLACLMNSKNLVIITDYVVSIVLNKKNNISTKFSEYI